MWSLIFMLKTAMAETFSNIFQHKLIKNSYCQNKMIPLKLGFDSWTLFSISSAERGISEQCAQFPGMSRCLALLSSDLSANEGAALPKEMHIFCKGWKDVDYAMGPAGIGLLRVLGYVRVLALQQFLPF